MSSMFDEWFELDGEIIMWKKSGHGIPTDRIARSTTGSNGYEYLWCRGRRFLFHRVKFYLLNGYLPKIVDHKDGDIQNNSSDNLRAADDFQSTRNIRPRIGCASQYKGVARKRNKWRAYITFEKKTTSLGVYLTEKEAALAYNAKAVELFGEFARLNIVD